MSDLVGQARAGDKTAFEQLYRENVGRVYALCLRMSGDAERAQDLTQEVFLQAWRSLGGFRGDSAFSSWLHRIAVNRVYQAQRAEVRRKARVAFVEHVADGVNSPGDPAARLDLERAIAELPPGARSAFVLHDVEGYTHREIAEMTGTAEGTIKAQLHRARALLRRALSR